MKKIEVNLQLFAEAEGQPATGAAETPQTTEANAGEGGDQVAPEAMSFDDMIKSNPEYEKAMGKKIEEAIGKRFKNQKDLQSRFDSISPALDALAARYGVAPGENGELDYAALQQKILNDDELYAEEALDRGMSIDDLKHLKQIEAENERLKRANEATKREQENREAYERFSAECEAVKESYPTFNPEEEMGNPAFGRLIASGVPVKTAYEVIHKDEILMAGMEYATHKGVEKVANAVKSNSARAQENGLSSQSAADIGKANFRDYKLSDFQSIKQRVMNGERITF